MPWAEALRVVTCISRRKSAGKGPGLQRIGQTLGAERLHARDRTHANRLIHRESDLRFIGPCVIDARGDWKFIPDLNEHRLTATARHPSDPGGRIHSMTIEGLLLEMAVDDHKPRVLFHLFTEMKITSQPHLNDSYSAKNRLAVAHRDFCEFAENPAGLFAFDG